MDQKYEPSEVILLGVVSINKQYDGVIEWSSKHRNLMKKHKKSVITSESKHHGSAGEYYSYGNKANFGKVELSSVAQYASRTIGIDSHLNGLCIEELSVMEMQMGINQLQKYIPILPQLISPLIAIAFRLQNELGDINLQQTSASNNGLWQTCFCINAETAEFHTENDCTYTLIHVPKQEKTNRKCKYFFSFKLSTDINVSFSLNKGTSVMFSGLYLTHRQLSNTIPTDKKDSFVNFASYGNARLYRHIRNSFKRVKEAKS